MDVQRDGSDFKIELVRKKVSQVGVVNTGEQLLASASVLSFARQLGNVPFPVQKRA
jgi:hypothetical protein